MASIRREKTVAVPAAFAWDAIADIGSIHRRLVPGFVVDCRLDGEARMVTFGNGIVAREVIVDLDPAARRLAWSASGGRLSHHNASLQVFPAGEGACRLAWIADLLPHGMRETIAAMIGQALDTMQATLESNYRADPNPPPT